MIRDKYSKIFLITSVLIFIFYFFFINLSFDMLLLFLPQKIFLGKWLLKGIFPLYNPHIFAGVPFAFDPGLGNLHPFNLFFLLPYPFSISIWAAAYTFLFLFGFYLFFSLLTKTKKMSLLLTFILFFSGSGLISRMNNPTIVSVIAHYGLFLYFLNNLKQKKKTNFIWPLLIGMMMTLAGHIQFVIYGYLLGAIVSFIFFKIPFKRLLLFFLLLFIFTSWYYIFSIPIILESTRLGASNQNFLGEKIVPLQYLQLILPFIFGEVYSGARWNVGYSLNVLNSILVLPLLIFTLLKGKYNKLLALIFIAIIILASGLISIPFFRISSQIFIVFQILALALIATNEPFIFAGINKVKKYVSVLIAASVIFLIFGILFQSEVFSKLFLLSYKVLKHAKLSPFFDSLTIAAIGNLFGKSLFLLALGFLFLIIAIFKQKKAKAIFIFYVIVEGLIINYFFNFFILNKYIPNNFSLPKNIDIYDFRIQTTADVVPYFGLSNYIDNIFFRPPFSKEKSLFDERERKTFNYFQYIMTYIPSNWSMVAGIKTIQGYNTFVPKDIAEYFSSPSQNFREIYGQILVRNPQFGKNLNVSNINAINTSFITMEDLRWQELGVRYFIAAKDNRYFYENKKTLPLYYVKSDEKIEIKQPSSENPNEMVFEITDEDLGKNLVINLNPAGFAGQLNNQPIILKKEKFRLIINLKGKGTLRLYYSPLIHLKETIFITLQNNLERKKLKG